MPLSRAVSAVFVGALAALVALAAPGRADAHAMRTAYVNIVEREPGRALVHLQTIVATPEVAAQFPPDCHLTSAGSDAFPEQAAGEPLLQGGPSQWGSTFLLRCPGPLAGRTITVTGLGTAISEAVVWATLSGGATTSHLLTSAAPSVRLPHASRPLETFTEHTALGLKHILEGADHLLFLLLLVLTLRRASAVLWAEAAFTLSHSLSFSAALLGWIRVSPLAAEACIALSLLLLALDVERPGAPAISTRAGSAMALVFGLVHGLGFAGGMREIGVPARNVAWALLGFGAGVEVGQVMVLIVVLGAAHLLARSRFYTPAVLTCAYASGGLAAFWLIERVLKCLELSRWAS